MNDDVWATACGLPLTCGRCGRSRRGCAGLPGDPSRAPLSPRSHPLNDHRRRHPDRPHRHPDDQAPSGTPPTGPDHVADVGIANDAAVGSFNGGQQAALPRSWRFSAGRPAGRRGPVRRPGAPLVLVHPRAQMYGRVGPERPRRPVLPCAGKRCEACGAGGTARRAAGAAVIGHPRITTVGLRLSLVDRRSSPDTTVAKRSSWPGSSLVMPAGLRAGCGSPRLAGRRGARVLE